MQNNNILLIVIAVIVIIVAFYFINQNNKSKTSADFSIQNLSPACIPYTKADQDAEIKKRQNECIRKAAVPFIGQGLAFECYRTLKNNLPPIKEC